MTLCDFWVLIWRNLCNFFSNPLGSLRLSCWVHLDKLSWGWDTERGTGGNYPSCFSHLKSQACEWGHTTPHQGNRWLQPYESSETIWDQTPTQLNLVPNATDLWKNKGFCLKAVFFVGGCGYYAGTDKQSGVSFQHTPSYFI